MLLQWNAQLLINKINNINGMSGAKKLNNKTEAKGCDILHITTKLINTLYALAERP